MGYGSAGSPERLYDRGAGSCECASAAGVEPHSSLVLLLFDLQGLLVIGLAGGHARRRSSAHWELPDRGEVRSRVVRIGPLDHASPVGWRLPSGGSLGHRGHRDANCEPAVSQVTI